MAGREQNYYMENRTYIQLKDLAVDRTAAIRNQKAVVNPQKIAHDQGVNVEQVNKMMVARYKMCR